MGFDLNENWQEAREHYDNQKIHSLTLPKVIRTSAFTARLDIEGCDPLALPVADLVVKVDMDAVIFSLMEVPEAQIQIAPSSHKVRIEGGVQRLLSWGRDILCKAPVAAEPIPLRQTRKILSGYWN